MLRPCSVADIWYTVPRSETIRLVVCLQVYVWTAIIRC